MVIKSVNIIAFGLLLIGCVLMLAFLPGVLNRFEREPEDLYLVLCWVALLFGIAALCFWNARCGPSIDQGWSIQFGANLVVFFALGGMLIATYDPSGTMIASIALAGPLAWLAAWTFQRKHRPRIRSGATRK
ncbi:hypothetical protein [Qipengyuania huizhouensis]|uniref:hypothetical protein n=1 Tax=Qipengyuania huizhouensis TaxID=2867245 RepID=UPI001C88960E|nr:hypothetical protein [Qipengyuania huizhouensis]MBX7460067.1 hypothetical protein [Qipengyuania huizhouensis]